MLISEIKVDKLLLSQCEVVYKTKHDMCRLYKTPAVPDEHGDGKDSVSFIAVEWEQGSDDNGDSWGDTSECHILFIINMRFDGPRHMYAGEADDDNYFYYPELYVWRKMFSIIEEYAKMYCKKYEGNE